MIQLLRVFTFKIKPPFIYSLISIEDGPDWLNYEVSHSHTPHRYVMRQIF